MKIILTICLLALAVPGWAGEPGKILVGPATTIPAEELLNGLQYSLNGSLKIDKASFEAMLRDYPEAKLRVVLTDDFCLAMIEQAMKAMDPFTPAQRVLHPEKTDGLYEATKLWNDAKRCWKETP